MRRAEENQGNGIAPSRIFATTHWSVVLAAGESYSETSHRALALLCETYWYPIYTYVRRNGHGPDDAEDLTQQFFARLIEKEYVRLADQSRGRFRTFLLSSLKHFLINEWTKGTRQKRGAGQKALSIDEANAESGFLSDTAVEQPSDAFYDRTWAATLLDRALRAMGLEFEQSGKRDLFDRLKGFVWGEKNGLSYTDMAAQLGMTEGAVKVAVTRLRQRYGELLRAEVAQTVTPFELDAELRYLVSILRAGFEPPGNHDPKML